MKYKLFKSENPNVYNHKYIKSCLIYDIETDSLDVNNAEMKFVGFYSYKYEKYLLFDSSEREAIQRLIDEHRILIGFNNKGFDNRIMTNKINNFDLSYKVCFDCLCVLYNRRAHKANRENNIKLPNGKLLGRILPNRKLATIAKTLNLKTFKGDIDYNIFKKNVWTDAELKEIYIYLYKDIDVTRQLFEFYLDYFHAYKELVYEKDVRNFNYVRSSLGSFSYSALCYLTNKKVLYENDMEILSQRPTNKGGYVVLPQTDYAEGTIIYSDFASLYPHIMFQCNMFSATNDDTGWNGAPFFNLQNRYKFDKIGEIEEVLKDLYNKRRKLKEQKDNREEAYKIIINTIYGISGSPAFKNTFNMTTSGDITSIGRRMLQFTIDEFEKQGFKVIYGDTDSCFIHLPKDKTIDDYKILAEQIVEKLKTYLLFPVDTFKLDIDDVFKKIWLINKKQYIGINQDNKLTIKGISIIKHDASKLGSIILEELKPQIIERLDCKFSREYINSLIIDKITKDITLIGRTYNVRDPKYYKSTTSIQYQIASVYGEGKYILIPNTKIGDVGKVKKYCRIEDSTLLTFEDLCLDKVWKELEPFIR